MANPLKAHLEHQRDALQERRMNLYFDSSTLHRLLTWMCLVMSAWIRSAQTWANVAELTQNRLQNKLSEPKQSDKSSNF